MTAEPRLAGGENPRLMYVEVDTLSEDAEKGSGNVGTRTQARTVWSESKGW